MFKAVQRWWKRLMTSRTDFFWSDEPSYRGLPHVGTMSDGSRVYSRMLVATSTPTEIVFVNGSYVRLSRGGFSSSLSGGAFRIVQSDGGEISCG